MSVAKIAKENLNRIFEYGGRHFRVIGYSKKKQKIIGVSDSSSSYLVKQNHLYKNIPMHILISEEEFRSLEPIVGKKQRNQQILFSIFYSLPVKHMITELESVTDEEEALVYSLLMKLRDTYKKNKNSQKIFVVGVLFAIFFTTHSITVGLTASAIAFLAGLRSFHYIAKGRGYEQKIIITTTTKTYFPRENTFSV